MSQNVQSNSSNSSSSSSSTSSSLGIFASAPDTSTYLKNELLVSLKAMQDKHIIEAIADPAKFIETRSNLINGLFKSDGKVTKHYDEALEEYSALNLPQQSIKDLAMKSTKAYLDQQMEILELQMPGGYDKAFSVAGITHNAKLARDDIAEETLDQYKARKKAKKAKKRAKKAGLQ